MTLTADEERQLFALSIVAGSRSNLPRIARVVLERDNSVTSLLRAAGCGGSEGDAAHEQIRRVLDSYGGGSGLNLLDLVVELGQEARERRGELRTWQWPGAVESPTDK